MLLLPQPEFENHARLQTNPVQRDVGGELVIVRVDVVGLDRANREAAGH